MQAVIVPVTPFAQNCSVVWCPRTLEAAVIDPGGDLDKVLAEVDKRGLKLTKILLTHAHIDHAGATAELARRESLPIVGPHKGDKFWIDGLHLRPPRRRPPRVSRRLRRRARRPSARCACLPRP